MKLSKCRIDFDTSENGKWFTYYGDIEFCIARTGCSAYQLEYSRVSSLLLEEYGESKDVPDEGYEKLIMMATACCVTDWRGIEDEDDKKLEYSHEATLTIFRNKEYRDILDFVTKMSNTRAHYRTTNIDSAKKT